MIIPKINNGFSASKNIFMNNIDNKSMMIFKNAEDYFEKKTDKNISLNANFSFKGQISKASIKKTNTPEDIAIVFDKVTEALKNRNCGYAKFILKNSGLKYYDLVYDGSTFMSMLIKDLKDERNHSEILPKLIKTINIDNSTYYIVKYPGYTREDYEWYVDADCTGHIGYQFLNHFNGIPYNKVEEEREKNLKRLEKTYKEVERLAKAGFIDASLDDDYLSDTWIVNGEGNIVSARKITFRELTPEENNPKYIKEYLKNWNTAMKKLIKGNSPNYVDIKNSKLQYYFYTDDIKEDNDSNIKNSVEDEKVLNKIENIIKKDINKCRIGGAIRKAKIYMKDNNIDDKYTILADKNPTHSRGVILAMLNNKDFTIFDNLVKKFSVLYFQKPIRFYILKKTANYKDDESDLTDFGEKKIPLESIEKAYKDIEKLAKLGYIDELNANWKITPDNTLRNSGETFRKLGPVEYNDYWYSDYDLKRLLQERKKELNPKFINNYLKKWKENMISINEQGIKKTKRNTEELY